MNEIMTLQHIFIANLKKNRKERGYSQMALAELCDISGNYIGQIEMGRRIPSFEKIERIAAALEIPSHELFACESREKQEREKPETRDYLKRMPVNVKKELVSRLAAAMVKDIDLFLDSPNY